MEHPAADPANPAVPVEPAVPAEPGTPVTVDPAPPTPSYAIGGTLTGLAGSTKLVLLDNGGDALTLAANGAFSFAAPIAFNTAYTVTVGTQPLWQTCLVSNGSGTATADVNSVHVSCVEAQAQVSTFAGSTARGSADGTGAAARFNAPQALVVNRSGSVYVADSDNNRIRKITPDGIVTTFAGSGISGWADGTGAAARFTWPYGVAVDGSGNVYVADGTAIRKITPEGVVRTLAGGGANIGSADGTGADASFTGPAGLVVDAGGNVYVADFYNNMIRKVTPEGVVTTLAGSTTAGSFDGVGATASFDGPVAVELDAAGNLYVADYYTCLIRKITPKGIVTTLAGSTCGFADGSGAAAGFYGPYGLAIDASGYLYVADYLNNRIRRITPDGVVSTIAGSGVPGAADGTGIAAEFDAPTDVAVDAEGNLYVTSGNSIRKITPVR
jgi:sugar lactone lactonase YvrE